MDGRQPRTHPSPRSTVPSRLGGQAMIKLAPNFSSKKLAQNEHGWAWAASQNPLSFLLVLDEQNPSPLKAHMMMIV